MRCAIDATALGSGRGGDETYLRGVLRGLAGASGPTDEFELLCRESAVGAVPEVDAVLTGRATWTPLANPGATRLISSLPRAWSSGRSDVALAYTHAPVPASLRHALIVTDLSFRHHPDHYPRPARVRLNTLVPFQARRADVVVTLSEFCRSDLIASYALDPERVHVVPCTIDPPVTAPDDDRTGHWLESEGVDRPFVLYLGNLHPRKNVRRLIDAYRRTGAGAAGDVQLVIAGAPWWGGGGEAEAAERCTPGSVVFLGKVTDEQRAALLAKALVLAYPSMFEGFGLPPLEAMQACTPVLTSDVTALPETVGDAAVLVDPFDESAITDGLDRLLESPDLRRDLVRLGLDRVAHFSTDRTGRAAWGAVVAASTAERRRFRGRPGRPTRSVLGSTDPQPGRVNGAGGGRPVSSS